MKRLVLLFTFCFSVFCGFAGNRIPAYYDAPSRVISSNYDGTVYVEATGKGTKSGEAYRNANKRAVYDVIFELIQNQDGCALKPLITEVNAKEKYEAFFNMFFDDRKGAYRYFCSIKLERIFSHSLTSSKINTTDKQVVMTTVILVDRSGLRDFLLREGILHSEH